MTRWPTGHHVVVRTLGHKRGVIVEAGRHGQYRVRVGNVTTWCREEDLDESPESSRTKLGGPKSGGKIEPEGLAWFTSFAPAGGRTLVVTVLVERTRDPQAAAVVAHGVWAALGR